MTVPAVVQIPIPQVALERSTLARIDYTDAFVVRTGAPGDRTAEQWARSVLEGAPEAMRRSLRRGWFALGLKIAAGASDELVLGWQIRRRTADHILLGAESRVGMPGELLFESRQDGVLFATLVCHQNPAVRAVWAAIERQHRTVVRGLLARSARAAAVPRDRAPIRREPRTP